MSVMIKEYEVVDKVIEAGLLYEAFQEGSEIGDVIKNSEIYKANKEWDRKTGLKQTEQGALREVVGRMLWYVCVANRVAYGLQYQENPDFYEGKTREELKKEAPELEVKKVDLVKVNEEARHLNYNMYTNDGNYFLAKEYKDLWDALLGALKKYEKQEVVGY